jgi:myo-inositol-1(or 4)-monophosphatase
VSKISAAARAAVVLCSPTAMPTFASRMAGASFALELLRYLFQAARGIRRPGVASIDLAYVACGRFDGFFETGLNPWDIAAGLLLVEEAGGRVTDYKGAGNPSFTHQVLATNGHIHGAMLEAVAGMRDIYG